MQFVCSTLCVALLLLVQRVRGDLPPGEEPRTIHSDALDCEYFHNCATPTPSHTPIPSPHPVTPSEMLLPSVVNVSSHLTTTVNSTSRQPTTHLETTPTPSVLSSASLYISPTITFIATPQPSSTIQPPYPSTATVNPLSSQLEANISTVSHQPIITLRLANNPVTSSLEKDAKSMTMVMMFGGVTAGIILIIVGIVICEVYVIYMIRRRRRRKTFVGETREMANSAQESSNVYSEPPLWTSTPIDIEVKKKPPFEDHSTASLPSPPGTTRQEANRSRPSLHSDQENSGDEGMMVVISVSVTKQKS